jgi:hypothetical protein
MSAITPSTTSTLSIIIQATCNCSKRESVTSLEGKLRRINKYENQGASAKFQTQQRADTCNNLQQSPNVENILKNEWTSWRCTTGLPPMARRGVEV